MNGLLHDDDLVLYFAADQQARHQAVLRLNEMARAMVERVRAWEAAEPEDDDADESESAPAQLRLVLGIDRDPKSAKQRRFLHGVVLKQIADQVVVDGVKYALPIWKEFFRKLFLGDRWEHWRMPGQKRAVPRRVRVSTEDLSVKQYSEYIERVLAHAATEFGVAFDLDPVEREAVRYRRKKRRQKAEVPA